MPEEIKQTVPCKGCGMPVFFEQGVPWYGKKVPILVRLPGGEYIKDAGYVSHFINCKKANDFSGSKKP
jgi:hypothetical protein